MLCLLAFNFVFVLNQIIYVSKLDTNQKQQHEPCTIINIPFVYLRSPYSISGGSRTQSPQKIYALLKFGVQNILASQHLHGIKVPELLRSKMSSKTDSTSYNNELSFEKPLQLTKKSVLYHST